LEWTYFAKQFDNPPVVKKGLVTLRVNRLDGAKQSCKIRMIKKSLQFTTSKEIAKLKTIIGSSITVSVNSGFPVAPSGSKQPVSTFLACRVLANPNLSTLSFPKTFWSLTYQMGLFFFGPRTHGETAGD
jgi:hypothetical protein